MRHLFALLSVSLLATPALAQTAKAPPAEGHRRLTWEQHFAQANTTHDGHLTLQQAKIGYITLARRFHDMDTDGKGYVTEDDIRAWHRQQRGLRAAAHAPTAIPTTASSDAMGPVVTPAAQPDRSNGAN